MKETFLDSDESYVRSLSDNVRRIAELAKRVPSVNRRDHIEVSHIDATGAEHFYRWYTSRDAADINQFQATLIEFSDTEGWGDGRSREIMQISAVIIGDDSYLYAPEARYTNAQNSSIKLDSEDVIAMMALETGIIIHELEDLDDQINGSK